jgi:prephenate dehydratase
MKRIALLGQGSFSDEAVKAFLGKTDYEFDYYKIISDVFMATVSVDTDWSVIPIENTMEGSVSLHMDWLVHEVDLPIQAEWVYPIVMNLIGLPQAPVTTDSSLEIQSTDYAGIRKVLTHAVVPSQCRQFLRTHLPHAEIEIVSSTVEAVSQAAKLGDPSVVAIGTAAAADMFGLTVLAGGIQDHDNNMTRFLLVGPNAPMLKPSESMKTTILITLPEDYPGALHQVLSAFAWRRINLSRIESRPTRKKLGNYYFYIEIEGSLESVLLPSALQEIEAIGCQVRTLGCYPTYSLAES